ncbi:SatD family protein [Microbacterium arabinogalactanolyticum]|uniref:SatD family protein n=1 Tax=Microbacterium arabinogalactanolyticum TaxID=69365 RepID=UPI004044F276
MAVVVTADIIGSRRLLDRGEAQNALDSAIAQVERDLPVAVEGMRPTVGDEEQAVYPTLEAALGTILLLRLALPDGVEFRYGIGIGEVGTVPSTASDRGISDGPGWWAARSAIEQVETLQRRTAPQARTWVVAHESTDEVSPDAVRWANAYLLSRDELVGAMSERTRRLAYGRCLSRTQSELAASEGITQSAVSQALSSSGAGSVVEGFRLLELT